MRHSCLIGGGPYQKLLAKGNLDYTLKVFAPPEEIHDLLRQHPKLIVADDYELTVQRSQSKARKYHNGSETLESDEDNLWVGLRILHRKQPGRSATLVRGKEDITWLVESAFESSRRASADPWFRFPLWKAPKEAPKPQPLYSPPPSLYPKLRAHPDILEEVYETCKIRNFLSRKSERFQLSCERSIYALHFSILNHFGERFFRLREDRSSTLPLHEDRERWLAYLLNQSHELAGGTLFSARENCPILFTPAVVIPFLRKAAGWFSAELVQTNKSPLSQKRGTPFFSNAISLVDDGTFAGGLHTHPFDMEGSPMQKTTLVDKGVVKDFLYDAYAATRENRLSTGNFLLRPTTPMPKVAPSNFFIAPSNAPVSDLLSSIDHGIAIETIEHLEWTPGAGNTFILKGAGRRISSGNWGEPVWEIHLIADLKDLFAKAVKVGNDLNFYGGYGSPSILFENMPLGI